MPKPEEVTEADFVGMDDWTFQVRYIYFSQRLGDTLNPLSSLLSKPVAPSMGDALKIFF